MLKALIPAIAALALSAPTAANATIIDFDEFTSPPVTCCFGSVTGPLTYPDVIIRDGNNSGDVMNSSGWNNSQTSGNNLFGTLSGSMEFVFTDPVDGVIFDLINGLNEFTFLVEIFDINDALISSQNVLVGSFFGADANENVNFANSGISRVLISGNPDFAVDTIVFEAGAVPETATWMMLLLGFVAVGFAVRRSRQGGATLAQLA